MKRLVASIAVGLLLAVGGLAALPALPASATTLVSAVVNFGTQSSPDYEYVTPACNAPGLYYYSGEIVQVYNPCGYRVWVHFTSGSTVEAYCVNPGGAIAYDLPIHYAVGDTVDIQVTTNPNQCDIEFSACGVPSVCAVCVTPETYGCQMGVPQTNPGFVVGTVYSNGCDYRIWLH